MKPAVEIHFSFSSLSKVVDCRVLLARRTLSAAGGNLCEVGSGRKRRVDIARHQTRDPGRGGIGRGFSFPRRGDRAGGHKVLTDVGGFDVLERLRDVNLHLGRCGGGTRGVRGTGIVADGRHGNSEVGVVDSKPWVGEGPR
jgi:hypothetical protein